MSPADHIPTERITGAIARMFIERGDACLREFTLRSGRPSAAKGEFPQAGIAAFDEHTGDSAGNPFGGYMVGRAHAFVHLMFSFGDDIASTQSLPDWRAIIYDSPRQTRSGPASVIPCDGRR